TDTNGCTATTSVTISEPSALSASAIQNAAVLCHGGTTTVTISASGGTAAYSGTGTFTVAAGSYTYTLTDAHGCTAATSITVTEPSALRATGTVITNVSCNGTTTGSVAITANGGTAPYSGTGTFSALTAGTYS